MVVDYDQIAAVTSIDRGVVEDIVRNQCNNDQSAVQIAVEQYFAQSGPFYENANGQWKTGSKHKNHSKKTEDESHPVPAKHGEDFKHESRRPPSRGLPARGDRHESRGRGGDGRGGKGHGERAGKGGRESHEGSRGVGAAPRAEVAAKSDPAALTPVLNGNHVTDMAPAAGTKPFPTAKGPTINAGSKPKEWSENFAPQAPALAEISVANPADASSKGDRAGRGRGGIRDGSRRSREEADGGRGKGKGANRRDARAENAAPPTATHDDPSAIAGLLQQPLAELPMPSANETLPLPGIGAAGDMHSSSLLATQTGSMLLAAADPAILTVGSGALPTEPYGVSIRPPSVPGPRAAGATGARAPPARDDSAGVTGVIMPSAGGISGGDSKLQFGFAASTGRNDVTGGATAGAGAGKLSFGSLDSCLSSNQDIVDTICTPRGGTLPGSLPLPDSLAKALPTSVGTALPGFTGDETKPPRAANGVATNKATIAGELQHMQLSKGAPMALANGNGDAAGHKKPAPGLTQALAGIVGKQSHALPQPGSAMPLLGGQQASLASMPLYGSANTPSGAAVPAGMPPGMGAAVGIDGYVMGGREIPAGQCLPADAYTAPPTLNGGGGGGINMAAVMSAYDSVAPLSGGPTGGYEQPANNSNHPAHRGPGGDKEGRSGSKNSKRRNKQAGGGGDRANGNGLHVGVDGATMMPPGLACNGNMGNGSAPGMAAANSMGSNIMQQQYTSQQQQQYAFVPPGMMPFCGSYGPTGMVYQAAGAGMYQPTQLYQSPPQYASQPHGQPYMAQAQQYVPQQQQQYMSQQSGASPSSYAYQQPQSNMRMSGGGGMGANGMGNGTGGSFSAHSNQAFGAYDDSNDYVSASQQGMFSQAPPAGYYRPS